MNKPARPIMSHSRSEDRRYEACDIPHVPSVIAKELEAWRAWGLAMDPPMYYHPAFGIGHVAGQKPTT